MHKKILQQAQKVLQFAQLIWAQVAANQNTK